MYILFSGCEKIMYMCNNTKHKKYVFDIFLHTYIPLCPLSAEFLEAAKLPNRKNKKNNILALVTRQSTTLSSAIQYLHIPQPLHLQLPCHYLKICNKWIKFSSLKRGQYMYTGIKLEPVIILKPSWQNGTETVNTIVVSSTLVQ